MPPEQRREAWAEAVATAPEGKVTGKHVAVPFPYMSVPFTYVVKFDTIY